MFLSNICYANMHVVSYIIVDFKSFKHIKNFNKKVNPQVELVANWSLIHIFTGYIVCVAIGW